MLSMQEAFDALLHSARPLIETEEIALKEAKGRVLAQDIIASFDSPEDKTSAMDGYAFLFDTIQKETPIIVSQRIYAGDIGVTLKKGEAARIFTGALLPDQADTVVKQEDCTEKNGTFIIHKLPKKGANVRQKGENIQKGQVILQKGVALTPVHIGLIASVGLSKVLVYRPLKVALMTTGNELLKAGEAKKRGAIYNSNGPMLLSVLQNFGCVVTDYGTIEDQLEATCKALQDASNDHDLLIVCGGMSVGDADFVKDAIKDIGNIQFWQVAIKPGKPLTYGDVNQTPIIGLPGNPVSSMITFLMFVKPYLLKMMGLQNVLPFEMKVKANFTLDGTEARHEFLRAKMNDQGELELYENQGSGILASLTWCDGLVHNPPQSAVQKGDLVRFIPLNTLMAL